MPVIYCGLISGYTAISAVIVRLISLTGSWQLGDISSGLALAGSKRRNVIYAGHSAVYLLVGQYEDKT